MCNRDPESRCRFSANCDGRDKNRVAAQKHGRQIGIYGAE